MYRKLPHASVIDESGPSDARRPFLLERRNFEREARIPEIAEEGRTASVFSHNTCIPLNFISIRLNRSRSLRSLIKHIVPSNSSKSTAQKPKNAVNTTSKN